MAGTFLIQDNSTLTGAVAAAGLALVGALSGITGGLGGLLSWLLVPIAFVAGGIAGDLIGRDGQIFGRDGIVARIRERFVTATVPEGYIANSPNARTTGVSSETVTRTGVALNMMHGMQQVFDMTGDARLEALKANAHTYHQRFGVVSSGDYIADVRERERRIANLIVRDIGNTYGEYSHATADSGNQEEGRARRTADRILLRNMEKGSLVCRHYAAIASVLLHEANVPNQLVTSHVNYVRRNRQNQLDMEFVESSLNGNHAYLITDQGNAVVEATTAGQDNWDRQTYRPILNGATPTRIIREGDAAIVEHTTDQQRRTMAIYGGHNGDGGLSDDTTSQEGVRNAMRETVRRFNDNNNVNRSIQAASAIANILGGPLSQAEGMAMSFTPGVTPPGPVTPIGPRARPQR